MLLHEEWFLSLSGIIGIQTIGLQELMSINTFGRKRGRVVRKKGVILQKTELMQKLTQKMSKLKHLVIEF